MAFCELSVNTVYCVEGYMGMYPEWDESASVNCTDYLQIEIAVFSIYEMLEYLANSEAKGRVYGGAMSKCLGFSLSALSSIV